MSKGIERTVQLSAPWTLRTWCFLAVKIVLTLLLFWWALSQVDLANTIKKVGTSDPVFMGLALICFFLGVLLGGIRWLIFLRLLNNPFTTSLKVILPITFMTFFFKHTLPSIVMADGVRVFMATKIGLPLQKVIHSVIFDRGMGFFALLFLGFAGMNAAHTRGYISVSDIVVTVVFLAFFIFLVVSVTYLFFRTGFALIRKVDEPLRLLARLLLRHPGGLTATAVLSLLIHLLAVSGTVLIGIAMDLRIGFVDALILIPPVLLASQVPVSLGGWGVREGAMLYALGLLGLPADGALAISIVVGLMGLMISALSMPAWIGRRGM